MMKPFTLVIIGVLVPVALLGVYQIWVGLVHVFHQISMVLSAVPPA